MDESDKERATSLLYSYYCDLKQKKKTPKKIAFRPIQCACNCGGIANTGKRFIVGHNGKISIEKRFFDKVVKEKNCWIWKGGMNGVMVNRKMKETISPARFSFQFHRKVILQRRNIVKRSCGNMRCVNPDHLHVKNIGG